MSTGERFPILLTKPIPDVLHGEHRWREDDDGRNNSQIIIPEEDSFPDAGRIDENIAKLALNTGRPGNVTQASFYLGIAGAADQDVQGDALSASILGLPRVSAQGHCQCDQQGVQEHSCESHLLNLIDQYCKLY